MTTLQQHRILRDQAWSSTLIQKLLTQKSSSRRSEQECMQVKTGFRGFSSLSCPSLNHKKVQACLVTTYQQLMVSQEVKIQSFLRLRSMLASPWTFNQQYVQTHHVTTCLHLTPPLPVELLLLSFWAISHFKIHTCPSFDIHSSSCYTSLFWD